MLVDLEYKPDAEKACQRMAAWWEKEILDRPTIQVCAPQPSPRPGPKKHHASLRDRWMDVDYVLDCAQTNIANTYWGGEQLPAFHPNLGPDVMAAAYGCALVFGENTSWSEPCLTDWADIPKVKLNPDDIYLRTILEMTRRALQAGRGKFLVGITDLHPGGDLAAALRDPQQLCLDLAAEPDRVHELLKQLRPAFFEYYEQQYKIMQERGQKLTTSWLPLFCEGRYYIPSNDFSCMISPRMFRDFFLDELIAECEWLEHSCYHLDGPDAIRHLDALLEIDALDAIQYVIGAGREPATRWLHVFKRIQDGGKNIQAHVAPSDIDGFMEALRPEGVMLTTWAASVEEAEALIAKVAKWPRK
ncbi:MAG: trimethylamine corrinoid protein 2 [Planctomycetota bacterium]